MLTCSKHYCSEFCHIGFCPPCQVFSNEPLFCTCGNTRSDPPIHCNQPPPYCEQLCQKKMPCGHICPSKCHFGPCPMCTILVTKSCYCEKELVSNVPCGKSISCGKRCQKPLACGHKCIKICHKAGNCTVVEEISSSNGEILKGCGQKCNQVRELCSHRCQTLCHPDVPCPDTPCLAEIRFYCKCRHRFELGQCGIYTQKSQRKVEVKCDSECRKHERNVKLAKAFGNYVLFAINQI